MHPIYWCSMALSACQRTVLRGAGCKHDRRTSNQELPMNHSKAIRNLSLALAFTAGVFAAPAYAQINVSINLAPPAPQYEIVPVIAPGYVWAPGYWGWSGERHVWVRGRTIALREGYRWEPDRWDQRDRAYFRTAGHWERDQDFKPAKVKKEKKHKDRDDDDRGDDRHHGKGNKHDR